MEIGFLFSFVTIAILVLLSGFFAGSETALTAASRVRLHTKEKEGNKRAALVNRIREKRDQMIGALMIGNNVVHVLSSALAANVLIKLFGEVGVLYATCIMTVLIVIYGEILPKTYALYNADSMAMRIAPIIRVVIWVFTPFTWAVTWIVRLTLKLVGVDIAKSKSGGSHLELLRGTIEMHHGSNEEVKRQRVMLRSILDLFEVTVADIMIHRQNMTMIEADRPVDEILAEVLSNFYSRIPVWRDRPENIIGVMQMRLLLKQVSESRGDLSKIDMDAVMLEPWFIPETTSLHDQLQAFRERKEHFAIVVDEYGALMGIVTLEDILEEIVGEIDDEVDENVPGVKRGKGGSYLAEGQVTIRDLNREFEWRLPDENYSTVAGLVLYESETIPDIGQTFQFHGLKFEVMKRERNRIMRVRITPPKPANKP